MPIVYVLSLGSNVTFDTEVKRKNAIRYLQQHCQAGTTLQYIVKEGNVLINANDTSQKVFFENPKKRKNEETYNKEL